MMATEYSNNIFASNLEINRASSNADNSFRPTMSSILRTDAGGLDCDSSTNNMIGSFDYKEVFWYIHQLQQEVISLSSQATAFKQDSKVINSVNYGANDALIAIKAELECQVEELQAQLMFKDCKISEYTHICARFSSKIKQW